MKRTFDPQYFVKKSCTKFHNNHENPKDDLTADTRLHTEGRSDERTWSTQRAFL